MEPPFKSGFVALLGRPNAGKSTLLNALLKTKLSIVSPKPQTTRHKILGILDGEGYQVCFMDTPGLIAKPKDRLQDAITRTARHAAQGDADLIVVLAEPGAPEPEHLAELRALAGAGCPVILALNKCDLPAKPEQAAAAAQAYQEVLKPAAVVSLSALKGTGVAELLKEIVSRLPEGPAYYEKGQLSDRWERFFAAEIIREQVFELYSEELPHAVAVMIEQFREGSGPDQVAATLYVERDGQKGLILGKRGDALRELVKRSTAALENFLSRRVELEVWVKVRKDWRKDPRSLKEFGYIP